MIRVPAPDITDPTDAIVKNTSCTICGSDLHMSALFTYLSSNHRSTSIACPLPSATLLLS